MNRIDDVIYELRQLIREVRYDKSLKGYTWVVEDLERLLADIEAQKDAENELDF
jgi:hypothetical protein